MVNILYKAYCRIKSRILIKFIFPLKNSFLEMGKEPYVILTTSIHPIIHNWGDDVSRVLVKLINPSLNVVVKKYSWNLKNVSDYLCIGSIITWMTGEKSIIWGSGVVYPERKICQKPEKVLAVRGPLTRNYLLEQGVDCPEIYGDPAVLFPLYYSPQIKKKFKLGIIPHFRDKQNVYLKKFVNNPDVLVIDVQKIKPWNKFIDNILSCDCIASSSLHGIILSDAYRIPNVWIEFEGGERKRFAFLDYMMSVNRKEQMGYLVCNTTCVDDLISATTQWKCTPIDTEKLMDVCPFI